MAYIIALTVGIFIGGICVMTCLCEYTRPNKYDCGDVVEYEYDSGVKIGLICKSELNISHVDGLGCKESRLYYVNSDKRIDRTFLYDVFGVVESLDSCDLVDEKDIFRKIKGDKN